MAFREILVQISIIAGIWFGIYRIVAWRREHRGKRQLELAEETLAMFYEASDAIKYIRHPGSYASESDSVIRGTQETDTQFQARKNAFVVFHRFNQYQELFNKIHASRYRYMAQIGKTDAAPFTDLREIENTIKSSARRLARLWAREQFRTDKQWEEHLLKIAKYEAVFWEGIEEDDPINPKIDKVIIDIEKTCQPIITGRGMPRSFLKH